MKTTTSVTVRVCPVPGSMTTPGNASTATPPQRRHAPSATGEGMPKQNWNNTSKKPGTGPPTNPSRSRTNLRNGKSSPTAPKIPHDGLRRKAAHRLHRLVGLLLPPARNKGAFRPPAGSKYWASIRIASGQARQPRKEQRQHRDAQLVRPGVTPNNSGAGSKGPSSSSTNPTTGLEIGRDVHGSSEDHLVYRSLGVSPFSHVVDQQTGNEWIWKPARQTAPSLRDFGVIFYERHVAVPDGNHEQASTELPRFMKKDGELHGLHAQRGRLPVGRYNPCQTGPGRQAAPSSCRRGTNHVVPPPDAP